MAGRGARRAGRRNDRRGRRHHRPGHPAHHGGGRGLASFGIQYKDADEWYTLTGSPLPHHGDPATLHAAALAAVRAGHAAQAPGTAPG
ncbi:hypothetical protein [Streptomyces sp. NBC_00162]|uniref:hypothetical protein n=1 Tax=Streptomyces sp. NBC_00162 TaxID=2903629 RepID=UPI00214B1896|nr:hypothetical protein [Streptomyces sp. NBC_00162]UUU38407.1 hypothetical protein JIW86_05845 [Streptomyces sp. NBC_00162]